MAALTTIAAVGSLAIGAYSYVQQKKANAEAQEMQRNALAEQKKAQSEQKAMNTAAAAQERRNQVREERVRRARVLQAAENSGVTGSSGEYGALGSLSTQLSNNLGINAGRIASANRISDYGQNAADFGMASQEAQNKASNYGSMFNLSMSIFGEAGGFGTIKAAGKRLVN